MKLNYWKRSNLNQTKQSWMENDLEDNSDDGEEVMG